MRKNEQKRNAELILKIREVLNLFHCDRNIILDQENLASNIQIYKFEYIVNFYS